MDKTVVLGYARTPFGKMGGPLAGMEAVELGSIAMTGALEKADVLADQVEHVSFGQVLQAGVGQIPSRQAQIKAKIPKEVPSETVNKVCASSMRAVGLVDLAVRAGEVGVAVAGGMESMSRAPYLLPGARFGYRMGDTNALDAMTHDGLTSPFSGQIMLAEASNMSNEVGVEREEMDAWAVRSHQRAAAAIEEGKLAEEIVPVTVPGRKGATVVEADETVRPETSAEVLAGLKPVGAEGATHTAGNAPAVTDGAAALTLASESWAAANGKQPLAKIVSYGMVATRFDALVLTPGRSAQKALEKAGIAPGDVDLWEVNEAFASVAVNTVRLLELDPDKVNVNGGAVALGHPIGASGARILGVLVNELRRRGGGIGCAAICSGGGQGDAIVIEV